MTYAPNRRRFLQTCLAAAAATSLATSNTDLHAGQFSGKIKKAVKYQMIRSKQSVLDKFKMLKNLGYDGVEIHMRDKEIRNQAAKASEATGLPIHGTINSSNPDIKSAIDLSKFFGGTSVLVVAGRVNKQVSYAENYKTTQEIIRRALPHAEKQGIRILVENVWNNFLLSPLEMARYIDELDSPAAGVYFDVGNVVRYGWPEHWIHTLGKRIGKLDIKEYSRKKQVDEGLWKGFQVEIGEGDCDWPAVRAALSKIGYQGWATAEVRGGDRQRMQEIAQRMDKALDL